MSADVERYSWGLKTPAGWIWGPGSRHALEGDAALIETAREIASLQAELAELREMYRLQSGRLSCTCMAHERHCPYADWRP